MEDWEDISRDLTKGLCNEDMAASIISIRVYLHVSLLALLRPATGPRQTDRAYALIPL
jgi:hypothetical protein